MRLLSLAGANLLTLSCLLCGCGINTVSSPESHPGVALTGTLHGGQQPVSGAHVYLMAASSGGYGKAATSLLTAGDGTDSVGTYVLTNGTGFFNVSAKYQCTANSEVYALALGGAASTTTPPNSAIALMTALGPCPTAGSFLAADPSIQITEVTTVAAAYALSGYLTGPTALSYSGTPLAYTGLNNAFATAGSLASVGTGFANASVGTNGTAPAAKVNTLANVIAACVNSAGNNSAECSTLFSNATAGAAKPTETITALLNIAHNPAANVAALYGLPTAASPFQPSLTTVPNDLSLAIQYTSPRLNNPQNLRTDASGNIWIRDDGGSYVLEKLGPTGTVLSGSAGFFIGGQNSGDSIALDAQGDAFVGNKQSFSVLKLGPDGTMLSPVTGYAGSCSNPAAKIYAVAIDANNNVWASGSGGCALKATDNGAVQSGATGFPSTPDDSYGIALDSSNAAWLIGSYDNFVRRVSSSGSVLGDYGSTVGGPTAIAIDGNDTAWITNRYYDSVTHLMQSGSFSMATGGGLHQPLDLAIDGANAVWVANNNSSISALSNAGTAITPANGYQAGMGSARSLDVDGSGNVWVAVDSPDLIVEFVGMATPASRPIQPGRLGVRP